MPQRYKVFLVFITKIFNYFIYTRLNDILKLGLRDIIYMVHKFVDHKVVYRYVF